MMARSILHLLLALGCTTSVVSAFAGPNPVAGSILKNVVDKTMNTPTEAEGTFQPVQSDTPILVQNNKGEVWNSEIRTRPRRNRKSAAVRAMVRENLITPANLIYPLFIHDLDHNQDIPSMPGCQRHSLESMLKEIGEAFKLGVKAFALFPVVPDELKTNLGVEAYNPDGIVPRAVRMVKEAFPDSVVCTDVALDPYSNQGHDGVVEDGKVLNDVTVHQLCKQAVCQARAGTDFVCPSDMMDGRVQAIRDALDTEGFTDVSILAYTAKYASAFYGPFRDALDSHPGFGDKKTYQQDPANGLEATLEASLDEAEGADMLMVKPGMPYLDVIYRLRQETNLPVAAYHVSGEYAMIKAACERGWLNEKQAVLEAMVCFRRAGANVILTYYAKQVAQWIAEDAVGLIMSSLFSKSHRRAKRKQNPTDSDQATATTVEKSNNPKVSKTFEEQPLSPWASFADLGLAEPLVDTCRALGFKRPTPVQRTIIPFLLRESSAHVLALAATGSGKTAAFALPILHRLSSDPYGIYAVIVSPTRELAKQIHQQILALGSSYNVESALVVGGMDMVRQSCQLDKKPHFVVATPGRLAELLRGPSPPRLRHVRFLVLDEADRLLAANSGFERDVAELLLHCNQDKRTKCQTLLFSATMTRSLESVEEMAGAGKGRLPLRKFIIKADDLENETPLAKKARVEATGQHQDSGESSSEEGSDNEDESDDESVGEKDDKIECQATGEGSEEALTPRIPAGLKQEYVFMPSRVRDAYLLATIRSLMSNGGRAKDAEGRAAWTGRRQYEDEEDDEELGKARSAIVFVATCERAALVSGILTQVGVQNVALHSLLSQNRRLAALGKFKSQQVRVLVATDVASRGLDIPSVDLVINSELPRNAVSYVHRVGRTARAGRRGRAVSLVAENDVSLVHAAEEITGRPLEKCDDVTDDAAIKMLGSVTKAARLAKMKLMEIGFDDLVKKFKERKVRDRQERKRIERALARSAKKQAN
eukprot:Nitzschia sp. Nitz4//scaffold70_size99833//69431//72788//NITZ4_004603-RA/size99833-processed-gene-0.120-mRNA-1//-1//CDS//3329557159//4486//frame0